MIQGVYLWAGSATIDLQRTKFPDLAVDEDAHRHAHSADGARMLADCGINLAFLSMNWGFPPELEQRHWEEFGEAVQIYRDAGIEVLGYVQASNYVRVGSFLKRDWHAVDPDGHLIPYFPDRMMACWNHPEWIAHVAAHAVRAVRYGANGVFFDNIWMGATPWTLDGIGGFAGCYCERCRTLFCEATGFDIPRALKPGAAADAYLTWRAGIVYARMLRWRAAILDENPAARMLANNCDVVLRNTRAMFGLDPMQLAPLQDAILIENVAMPHVTARRLVANALPLKALQTLAAGKQVLGVAYERGIGLDGPPDPGRVRRFIAEATAVGASPVLKGSEYLDSVGRFSVLTAPCFESARDAARPMLNWIAQNHRLFSNCTADPDVLIPIQPGENWTHGVRPALAMGLEMIHAQTPFGFVPSSRREGPEASGEVYASRLAQLADPFMRRFARAYFGGARFRRSIDRTGLTARFLQSEFFQLAAGTRRATAHVSTLPGASCEETILVERWRTEAGRVQLRLVNYTDGVVVVRLTNTSGKVYLHTPDQKTHWLDEELSSLNLDCFAILEFE